MIRFTRNTGFNVVANGKVFWITGVYKQTREMHGSIMCVKSIKYHPNPRCDQVYRHIIPKRTQIVLNSSYMYVHTSFAFAVDLPPAK